MARFVLLAVFALTLFTADAQGQGFDWKSGNVPNSNPVRTATYPWWDEIALPDKPPVAVWNIGVGQAIFPDSPPRPGGPPPRTWTMSAARVEMYTNNPVTGVWSQAPDEVIPGEWVLVNNTRNKFDIIFKLQGGSTARNYVPGQMVRLDVMVTATDGQASTGNLYLISRTVKGASKP